MGSSGSIGWGSAVVLGGVLALGGCASPCGKVTDTLRQQTIDQGREVGRLKGELANRDATIAHMKGNQPTIASLPEERLAGLFTADKVEVGSQTMATSVNTGDPVNCFRVVVKMAAADGTVLPATGDLTIEAFELSAAPAEPRRVGTWKFGAAEMKKSWYGGFGSNHFAFVCPWKAGPWEGGGKSGDVSFRAIFTDGLTGRTLVGDLTKKITVGGR